jgi:multimeric flavodoxin WrbA
MLIFNPKREYSYVGILNYGRRWQMKYLIVSGNPKNDGLCHEIMRQIAGGAGDGGAEVEILTVEKLERCHVCTSGWGSCRELHRCIFGDDGFDAAQSAIGSADCICLITPVYWWEMAEGLKSFLDRLRRCEFGQEGRLSGKPVLLAASAGGTGNGLLTCLEQMERFCRHTGAVIFDYIGVNRWNSDYKGQAAYMAARKMAEGRPPGQTI